MMLATALYVSGILLYVVSIWCWIEFIMLIAGQDG